MRSTFRTLFVVSWALLTAEGLGPMALSGAWAADPFDEINRRFQQKQQEGQGALLAVQDQYRAKRAAMEAQWRRKEQEIEARWQQQKQAIEQKWEQALRSTPKEWVDYASDNEARSVVDFENGTVEVTALAPVGETGSLQSGGQAVAASLGGGSTGINVLRALPMVLPASLTAGTDPLRLAAAWHRILRQFEQVFAQEAQAGRPVLAEQVVTREGRPVDGHTVQTFVQQEVLSTAVAEEKPVESRDGVARVKVTARVKMAPDHVKKRAQQYQDVVPVHAKRHGLDPRILYAIIHTESYFNPRAQSPVPTYGLMQLVPRGAARDDKVLDDAYLLDPANNVELGAAYLHLLNKQLLVELNDSDKKTYLLICAYKWGPDNTKAKILKQVRVQELTDSQVFALLTQRTPEETRMYLKQVKDRMALYEELTAP